MNAVSYCRSKLRPCVFASPVLMTAKKLSNDKEKGHQENVNAGYEKLKMRQMFYKEINVIKMFVTD